jgi:hypothetical protein
LKLGQLPHVSKVTPEIDRASLSFDNGPAKEIPADYGVFTCIVLEVTCILHDCRRRITIFTNSLQEVVMVLVRFVFQTEWGKAHEVAARMVEFQQTAQKEFGDEVGRWRILTDLSGPFHTVVQEVEVESLAEWERNWGRMFAHPKFQEMQAEMEGLFVSGRTEFYTIEG